MALKIKQPGIQPLGQFDALDADIAYIKGGEVVTFASVLASSDTDKGAADSFDGYINPNKRVVVTRVVASTSKPIMLADDGIAGYGTLFGSVVGGTAGQIYGTPVLGPHTAVASGKITCWDKPGLYAISLDACADDLQPSTASLDAGDPVYGTAGTGVLTSTEGSNVFAGYLVEFETTGSLVTTPNYLASAVAKTYAYAVIWFNPCK